VRASRHAMRCLLVRDGSIAYLARGDGATYGIVPTSLIGMSVPYCGRTRYGTVRRSYNEHAHGTQSACRHCRVTCDTLDLCDVLCVPISRAPRRRLAHALSLQVVTT
jgi:hypothetical protein